MPITNINPNPKDVVILQRDDTNSFYGEAHISGSSLIIYIDSSGHINADVSSSFYTTFPPVGGLAATASYAIVAGLSLTSISASHANNSDFAITASHALNGGGGGGGTNLLGVNGYVPVWLNNNLTITSSLFINPNNVSINSNNPSANDTLSVTELNPANILWNPTLLNTPTRFWYKADNISLVSASFVSLWPDSSPYNNYAVATSPGAEPLLTYNVLNGYPAVTFDGVNDQLKSMSPTSVSASAVTAFVVARVNGYASSLTPSSVGTIIGNSHSGDNRDIVIGEYFDGGLNRFVWSLYTEDSASSYSAITPQSGNAKTGQWYINTVIVNGIASSTTIYQSGSAFSSGTTVQSTNLDLRDLFIGYESSSNLPFNGDIAEIIVITQSLSTGDQQNVEGYLAWKYGLQSSLPSGHPYSGTPPTPQGGGNVQIWKDFNNNTLAFLSASGILYVTSSYAISASWAPPSPTASWALNSISSSYAGTASVAISASSALQSVSASWAPPIPSDFSISASWASQSFWSVSSSYASNSFWAISSSFSSQSAFSYTASFASSSASSSLASTASFAITASYSLNLNQTALSASFASQSISASYAGTASYVLNPNPNAISASWASSSLFSISASYSVTSSYARTASVAISASWAPPIPSDFSISASWASQSFLATTSSFASTAIWSTSSSFASKSVSSSCASSSLTASFAISASWSPNLPNPFAISASFASQSISASWAPTFTTIGTNYYLPKWVGNSLTTASLVYDNNTAVGINATSSQIEASLTVKAFSPSGSVLWNPSYLISTIPRLWLRADDIPGSTSASVSVWNDTSSYGNNFTQGSPGNQPMLVTSYLNGHNIVRFNGSSDGLYIVSGSTSIPQSSLSCFIVANTNTYPGVGNVYNTAGIIGNGHSGQSEDFILGPRNLSGQQQWAMYNEDSSNDYNITANVNVTQSWLLVNGEVNGGLSILTLYFNNAATSSGFVNGSSNIDLRDLYVGYEINYGSPFNGDIAEIIITNQVLSSNDQRNVEGYLAWKYGMQSNLPPDHQYKNIPPYILDYNKIQSWKDITATTVAYISSSGQFVGTSSFSNFSTSASWAPPSGVSAFSISSSFASSSMSSSYVGPGTTNYLTKWVNSGSLADSNFYINPSTLNVGLNTNSPSGSFTILYSNTDSTNTNGNNSHIVLTNPNNTSGQNAITSVINGSVTGKWRSDISSNVTYVSYANNSSLGHFFLVNGDTNVGTTKLKVTIGGVRIGQSIVSDSPSALLHLGGGDGAAGHSQLKFDSSTLLGTPEAGAVEFNTDNWYGTINTGTSRKQFALCDIPLASGSIVGVTANGRLTNATGSSVWNLSASYAFQSLSSSISASTLNQLYYIPFTTNTGSNPFYISSFYSLNFNPSTSTLTTSNISSSLFGTSSWAISSSYTTTAGGTISASYAGTASYVVFPPQFAVSASFASQSISASWAPVPISASWASASLTSTSASYSITSSVAISASWAPPVPSVYSFSSSWASQSLWSTTSSYASSSMTSSYTLLGRSIVLCSAYSPITTGGDAAEITVPYSPLDGTSSLSWGISRLNFRVQTIETITSSVNIEKSVGTGIFSASYIGSVFINSGSYESSSVGNFGRVNSGDKLRFNVITLGTAQNWTVITEINNS